MELRFGKGENFAGSGKTTGTIRAARMGDIWHIKGVRMSPVGQAGDHYLEHMRYEPKKVGGAGRRGDPRTGGGCKNIEVKDGKPEFMNKDGKPANKGGNYWLKAEDAAPFDDGKFQSGDEVASITVLPKQGDAGDIAAGMTRKDGVWTVEMAH